MKGKGKAKSPLKRRRKTKQPGTPDPPSPDLPSSPSSEEDTGVKATKATGRSRVKGKGKAKSPLRKTKHLIFQALLVRNKTLVCVKNVVVCMPMMIELAAKDKWMGCDSCDRWFHYDCLGLHSIPDGFWSCDQC